MRAYTPQSRGRGVHMKRAAGLFIIAALMSCLFIFIKSESQFNLTDKAAAADMQEPFHSFHLSGITSVPSAAKPSVLMRGQTLTQELSDLLEEKNIKNPLFEGIVVILSYFPANSGRDVLFLFSSVCLVFSGSLLNQVSIIHRSDGKKRAVFF